MVQQDQQSDGRLTEWLMPAGFILCGGWLVWHMPAFILDWNRPEGSDFDKLAAQFNRVDVTPGLPSIMGDFIDIIDVLALIGLFVFLNLGAMTVRRAPMEFEAWSPRDRVAVFIGRVTMLLIAILTLVMLSEVFMRYVINDSTIWATELSLWLAGFVFLMSGLYAMQQRSHIRIYLLYDVLPRWAQRACDVVSTVLIVLFAAALIYGGANEAFGKFYRWELYGTAFDPPLPATIKPMILIVVALVAVQSILNLFADWNAEPVTHSAADDIDQDELERLKSQLGDTTDRT